MRRLKTLTEFKTQLHKTTDVFTWLQDEDVLDAFTPTVSFDLGSRSRCPVIHLHDVVYKEDRVDVTYDIEKDRYVLFLYTNGKSYSLERTSEFDVVRILRSFENRDRSNKLPDIWIRIRNIKNYPQ